MGDIHERFSRQHHLEPGPRGCGVGLQPICAGPCGGRHRGVLGGARRRCADRFPDGHHAAQPAAGRLCSRPQPRPQVLRGTRARQGRSPRRPVRNVRAGGDRGLRAGARDEAVRDGRIHSGAELLLEGKPLHGSGVVRVPPRAEQRKGGQAVRADGLRHAEGLFRGGVRSAARLPGAHVRKRRSGAGGADRQSR